jgi:soluble lytic murein transglycosylase
MDRRTGQLIGLLLGSIPLFWGTAAVFPANADVYRFVDEKGVAHFSNVPTRPEYTVYFRENGTKRPRPAAFPYETYIREAAEAHGVDVELVKAIIKVESDFDPWAVSHKGARGLMQLMPENCRRLRLKNPFDPRQNILAGTRFFRSLMDRFHGDIALALAAYNAGPETVDRHRGIPPFQETRAYVKKVFRYYRYYREG